MFVALAVSESLRFAHALLGASFAAALESGLDIAVLGDNDFYSQKSTDARPFAHLGVAIADVNKTGLGSSAAMTTSLCAAIVLHLGALADRTADAQRAILHRLAQYVHSRAQGKVGSGFDVAAATFGSHAYTRFDPACLGSLLDAQPSPSSADLRLVLADADAWSDRGAVIEPFALPPLTTLVLADVRAGSHTPSMVSKVLAWRKREPEVAEPLWRRIGQLNAALAVVFVRLAELYARDAASYSETVARLAAHRSSDVRARTMRTD